MASGTARTRRRSAQRTRAKSPGGALSLVDWIGRITPAGWIALGACGLTLALSLQTLQSPSVEYDEGVYWQSLRALAAGHPLFGSIFSSQPPLFLLSVYPFYMIFGQSLTAARLALLCFALLGLAGVYVAGHALGHRAIGALACLLLALDPLYLHAAHIVQAESPSLALQIWAVACALLAMRVTGRRRGWLAVGAGVLLGCALMVKLFAIATIVPIVLLLSAPLAKRWLDGNGQIVYQSWTAMRDDLRQIASTLGLCAAGMAGAIILVLLPFVGQLGTVFDQTIRFHLATSALNRPLADNLALIVKALLAPPLLYISVLALGVIIWRRAWMALPLLVWALADFVVLARQQPLLDHHVVLLSPALALIAGYGAYLAWQLVTESSRRRIAQGVVLALLAMACVSGLALNIQRNAEANAPLPIRSLKMAIALQGVTAPTEDVLTDDQYIAALANRDVPPPLVDTSAVRITSGYLTAEQLEDYITRNRIHVILFASGRFDLLPGFRDWVAARYTRIASFDHGGALYLLEPDNNAPV